MGGFGAETGQVPAKVPVKVWEALGRLWCRARSGSTGFRRMFRRRLGVQGLFRRRSGTMVQSQVRFNRVPEKVKVWEALVQSQVRFNRVPEKVPEKVCEAWVQTQLRYLQRLASLQKDL